MNLQEIKKHIMEFSNMRDEVINDEPAILEAALFIEDEFGFVLTDDEISLDNLGTSQHLVRFVSKKLKVSDPGP